MKRNEFLLFAFSAIAFSQKGINITNSRQLFHVDGEKDNPSAGDPNPTQQTNDFAVTEEGKVGVEIINPGFRLHTYGGKEYSAYQLHDGGQGKFLSNNEVGRATWGNSSLSPIVFRDNFFKNWHIRIFSKSKGGIISGKVALLLLVFVSSFLPLKGQVTNMGEVTVRGGTVLATLSDFENRATGEVVNDGEWYVYGHYHNNGITRFTAGEEGRIRFEGYSKVQRISGNGSSRFFHVLFSNNFAPDAFELSSEIHVGGTAEFREGVVQAGNKGLLIVEQGGDHEQTSDGSYLDGYVQKDGNNIFLFPIGNAGYYRFAGILPEQEKGPASFRARYFLEDPDGSYPRGQKEPGIELIDDAEYWEIWKESGEGDARITLSWRDVTTPAFILGEPKEEIHIVRWDETDLRWKDEGGETDPTLLTVTTPTPVSSYGIFTLARVGTIKVDLRIQKTSMGAQVFQGDVFDYILTVENNGEEEATDVVIVDNLPTGLSYVDASFESAFGLIEETVQTEVTGNTVAFRVPTFAVGDQLTITLRTRAEVPGSMTNYAVIGSRQIELTPEDNEDTDQNEVRALFIPNVITPGTQDGYNDHLIIDGLAAYPKNRLVIFNRWGDHVFEAENYQHDWNAEALSAGTYFYILTVYDEDDSESEFKGWIQVIKKKQP